MFNHGIFADKIKKLLELILVRSGIVHKRNPPIQNPRQAQFPDVGFRNIAI